MTLKTKRDSWQSIVFECVATACFIDSSIRTCFNFGQLHRVFSSSIPLVDFLSIIKSLLLPIENAQVGVRIRNVNVFFSKVVLLVQLEEKSKSHKIKTKKQNKTKEKNKGAYRQPSMLWLGGLHYSDDNNNDGGVTQRAPPLSAARPKTRKLFKALPRRGWEGVQWRAVLWGKRVHARTDTAVIPFFRPWPQPTV